MAIDEVVDLSNIDMGNPGDKRERRSKTKEGLGGVVGIVKIAQGKSAAIDDGPIAKRRQAVKAVVIRICRGVGLAKPQQELRRPGENPQRRRQQIQG
jgi:hypothetical protein